MNRTFKYFKYDSKNATNKEIYIDYKIVDRVLSFFAESNQEKLFKSDIVDLVGENSFEKLIRYGILNFEGENTFISSPVFFREDADELRNLFEEEADDIAEKLMDFKEEINNIILKMTKQSSLTDHYYNLICASYFDGRVFDNLIKDEVVSEDNGYGFVYIIYEKCKELEEISNHLLLSYNRFSHYGITFQSFGDANGERSDFYRINQKLKNGKVVDIEIKKLWFDLNLDKDRDYFFRQFSNLMEGLNYDERLISILENFEYMKGGRFIVPVYSKKDKAFINELHDFLDLIIYKEIEEALSNKIIKFNKLGKVNENEIRNELYHILFGRINEALLRKGFVKEPIYKNGEGRYRKSIEYFT